jgi:hypothetical protein
LDAATKEVDPNANAGDEISHASVEVRLEKEIFTDEWVSLELSNIVPYLEKDPKNLESFNEFVASQLNKKPKIGIDNVIPISGADE